MQPNLIDQEISQILQPFQKFGVNLGLTRIEHLLKLLDHPEQKVPIIHVAGSNGKGSVCAYLAEILQQAGYRVGRYTSPHLVSWTERIQLDGQPITHEELQAVLRWVIAAVEPEQPTPTLFEIVTAAAFLFFAERQVDVAVMEVGLGGRLDATNVCDRPLASIITSISKEHWQVLGETLTEIAWEKAGVLKAGCPAIAGPLPPEAQTVVQKRAETLDCPLTWVEPAQLSAVGQEAAGQEAAGQLSSHGIQYSLALEGPIQRTNSAIALATVQALRQQGWTIADEAVIQGLAQTRWPGRMEWQTWQGQKILTDGAHNPAAAQALRDYVDTLESVQAGQPVHWVMGMLSTKEHQAVFEKLLRDGDRLYTAPVPEHSSADPEALAQLAQQVCPGLAQVTPTADVFQALERAMVERSPQAPIVFCGSLYLLGYFLATGPA